MGLGIDMPHPLMSHFVEMVRDQIEREPFTMPVGASNPRSEGCKKGGAAEADTVHQHGMPEAASSGFSGSLFWPQV